MMELVGVLFRHKRKYVFIALLSFTAICIYYSRWNDRPSTVHLSPDLDKLDQIYRKMRQPLNENADQISFQNEVLILKGGVGELSGASDPEHQETRKIGGRNIPSSKYENNGEGLGTHDTIDQHSKNYTINVNHTIDDVNHYAGRVGDGSRSTRSGLEKGNEEVFESSREIRFTSSSSRRSYKARRKKNATSLPPRILKNYTTLPRITTIHVEAMAEKDRNSVPGSEDEKFAPVDDEKSEIQDVKIEINETSRVEASHETNSVERSSKPEYKRNEESRDRVPSRKDTSVDDRPQTLSDGLLKRLLDAPYPPLIVRTNGSFLERVQRFTEAIEQTRKKIFLNREYKEWTDVGTPDKLKVVWGSVDDFLERLSKHKQVTTVMLAWNVSLTSWSEWSSLQDDSNVLVNRYYEWTASEPLCRWIETPGLTKAHWDAVYNRQCNTDVGKAAPAKSLDFMYFHSKPINANHYWPNDGLSYPSYFYVQPPPEIFYLNLLPDAVINLSGDVISGDVKVVPYTCSHDYIPTVPIEYQERPVYREVFVMTQFWGSSYFHKMLEVMPRIAPYVEFLRSHTNIQIHSPEDRSQVSNLLRMFKINPERIVTGIVRAKLVYLPQGTPCGFPHVQSLQLLSHRYRQYISENLPEQTRNRLVLIRRSGTRRFVHQTSIEGVLQQVAGTSGLNFTIFTDSPSPSIEETMAIFHSAVIVVGPHGAGLSNVVFCVPGTLVIEGVCNPPHVNMCFQMTAHVLGHRYHGIPSKGGCERVVDVSPYELEDVVKEHLKFIRSKH